MTRPFHPRELLPQPIASAESAAQDREQRNAEGTANSCYSCPECGDSAGWKAFHDTPYYTGWMQSDTVTLPSGIKTEPVYFHGHLGVIALCQECWQKLTPQQRLPHYEKRVAGWQAIIRPMKKMLPPGVDPDDADAVIKAVPIDEPGDAERFREESALIEQQLADVRKAVLAGL